MDLMIQSNSLKGQKAHQIVKMTMNEILEDIRPLLGPGASDAFIVKDGSSYYTRDGMEVMESLTMDNELSNYIHHIMFQAARNQGTKVGDGTTTLEVLYAYIYLNIRSQIDTALSMTTFHRSINFIREIWGNVITRLNKALTESAVQMTDEHLKSMLLTCTQDKELAAKIYTQLHDAIMAGAYIVPRQSNNPEDFTVTTYTRPTFKATKQFTLKPVEGDMEKCVLFYCNGSLDIAHWEVLFEMITAQLQTADQVVCKNLNIMILCHGTTDRTRRTLKELVEMVRIYQLNLDEVNNLAIYTMDDYRKFDRTEVDDICTIITDEPGLNGMMNALTFETLLYRTFFVPNTIETKDGTMLEKIDDLETFDIDIHHVEKMKDLFMHPFYMKIDETEGISMDKPLGPRAQLRHDELQQEIQHEKSDIRKVELSRRMRRIFGMFIDVEVGSKLLKDSQRKYELVLDAIISSAEGVRYGVIEGNSILHVMQVIIEMLYENNSVINYQFSDTGSPEDQVLYVLLKSFEQVAIDLIANEVDKPNNPDAILDMLQDPTYDIKDFNLTADPGVYWPPKCVAHPEDGDPLYKPSVIMTENGEVAIPSMVVEPVSIIKSILENSITPVELAMTKVFHISGVRGYMNNFIASEVDAQ